MTETQWESPDWSRKGNVVIRRTMSKSFGPVILYVFKEYAAGADWVWRFKVGGLLVASGISDTDWDAKDKAERACERYMLQAAVEAALVIDSFVEEAPSQPGSRVIAPE